MAQKDGAGVTPQDGIKLGLFLKKTKIHGEKRSDHLINLKTERGEFFLAYNDRACSCLEQAFFCFRPTLQIQVQEN